MTLHRYIDQQSRPYEVVYSRGCVEQADLFVVIPCFNEPDLIPSLRSLLECRQPKSRVAVVVVVNSADNAPAEAIAQNQKTIDEVICWANETPLWFALELLHAAALPNKWAGVGWARKIGFDRAVWHLANAGKKEGLLLAFDADSTTLPNFLTEVESTFAQHPKANFATIHFEHPVDESVELALLDGIIRYELHLRYLRLAMEWCGYPHAIHTVGSSMAVRATAYARQGGMNRRKAGEDFYFLHKLVLLGEYGNINTTTIIPASRISDRVPFGTGAALRKWGKGDSDLMTSYAPESFAAVRPFISKLPEFYQLSREQMEQQVAQLHRATAQYILQNSTLDEIDNLRRNCSDSHVFGRRVYHLVNAFWLIRYLNTMQSETFPRSELSIAAQTMLGWCNIETFGAATPFELLMIYRRRDLDYGFGSPK